MGVSESMGEIVSHGPSFTTLYEDLISRSAKYRQAAIDVIKELPPEELAKLMAVMYAATGLAGEAGEVSNKVKKILRDNRGKISEEKRQQLLGELGGVQWYITALAQELGFTITDVMQYNYEQIQSRLERDAIGGDGDNR